MSRRRHHLVVEDATEINLSSMIDCIFILLIFFIVTTVFVEEKGLQVSKPDATASASPRDTIRVTLEITADNKILVDESEIDLSDVSRHVAAGMADAETPVVIRANAKANHGVFVSVWDAARRGGGEVLSFQTIN